MSENDPTLPEDEAAEPSVKRSRGVSPIWLIPIVAVVVAASLAYEAIQNRGPKVVITFESGEGLVAGSCGGRRSTGRAEDRVSLGP